MNKNKILDQKKNQYKKNNILFGDLTTDVLMEENMGIETSLRIGYLDMNKIKMLEEYQKHFDVVILGEGDFLIA